MTITHDEQMSSKTDSLKELLLPYGIYDVKYSTLYLDKNESLTNLEFLEIMTNHKFFIQPKLL